MMSHKWTCDAVEWIAHKAMSEVQDLVEQITFFLSYDNKSVSMYVFFHHINNSSSFTASNGSTATMYIKPSAQPLSKEANANLCQSYACGMQNPL